MNRLAAGVTMGRTVVLMLSVAPPELEFASEMELTLNCWWVAAGRPVTEREMLLPYTGWGMSSIS